MHLNSALHNALNSLNQLTHKHPLQNIFSDGGSFVHTYELQRCGHLQHELTTTTWSTQTIDLNYLVYGTLL